MQRSRNVPPLRSQKLKICSDASPSNAAPSPALLPGMEALRDNMGDTLFGVETENVRPLQCRLYDI